jgi:DNA modification methylase
MDKNRIIVGDALDVLKTLPDGCANTCVTSPPYFRLRDYGVPGQIGQEETPAAYVARLTEVFRELRRVLKYDGTLWLVIADSYAGVGQRRDQPAYSRRYWSDRTKQALSFPASMDGAKPKDMLGIPWSLSLALRDDGWHLRSDIIWRKPNALPHSVTDRPVSSYEHVFLLAKSPRYYFDYHALEEPMLENSKARYRRNFTSGKYESGEPGRAPSRLNQVSRGGAKIPNMRRGRDIWDIPTVPYKGAHYAAFPPELARRCIAAGCPPGELVIDPFIGSGVTALAALESGRDYLGIELNPEYAALAEERIAAYEKV